MQEAIFRHIKPAPFGPRRGKVFDIADVVDLVEVGIDDAGRGRLETIDAFYRTLCGVLYNFVPTSGHPGGSISSGRIVASLLYGGLDYDLAEPDRIDADLLVYAAGHKALGLYAGWALRNELVRAAGGRLAADEKQQLRFEDLLGFRRNITEGTPLFMSHKAKALDGHPTPATPFVPIATGASGVGVPTAFGLALAALDTFGGAAPFCHVLEGEGGMTPGRVHEALSAAATGNLFNVVLHVDWNQASIDSNRVCAENGQTGDYVQWNPAELAYLHDWNVITVNEGFDFRHILAAQALAAQRLSGQPTAIVYRTVKGWMYGIEGRASHGAGHAFCSEGYYQHVAEPFEKRFGIALPKPPADRSGATVEATYFETLMALRRAIETEGAAASFAASRVDAARSRLDARKRQPRADAPRAEALYSGLTPETTPESIRLKAGSSTTLRGALGEVINVLNKRTGGAFLATSADLLDSTSVSKAAAGLGTGYFNAATNPGGRLVSVGGICEDAMGGFMAGLSTFGRHVGVTSSYGAFIAALEHIIARLHGIGQQARAQRTGDPYCPFIIVNAHAGIKTGEDGPTHADPQCLQLLQENFPKGVCVTLTPWEPQEMWPLVTAALRSRPAVICPFVTRPNETVPDREALGIAPFNDAIKGVYALVKAAPGKPRHGTLVLQGSEVGIAFTSQVLPTLRKEGINLDVYYVASAELFDRLPEKDQEALFPAAHAAEAMGITGFTQATMYRWVTSAEGRRRTLHPFREGRFLGSGRAEKVMEEGGLHPEGMLAAIRDYARFMESPSR